MFAKKNKRVIHSRPIIEEVFIIKSQLDQKIKTAPFPKNSQDTVPYNTPSLQLCNSGSERVITGSSYAQPANSTRDLFIAGAFFHRIIFLTFFSRLSFRD